MDAHASLQSKLRQLREERSGETRRKAEELRTSAGSDITGILEQFIPDAGARAEVLRAAERGDQARAMELAQRALGAAPDGAPAPERCSSDEEEAPPPPPSASAEPARPFRPRCEQQPQRKQRAPRRKKSRGRGRRR